jgi:hypothetical protein
MRKLYREIIPYELRFLLYKLRHPSEFRILRSTVYPSPKGDFSLGAFDRHQCIFIHIPKSAGTSVAKSLFGELPYHYSAIQYRVIFGRRAFNRYFKFAFVRNPWDRLYSAYSYLRGGGWNEKDREWFQKNISHLNEFNKFVLEWLEEDRLKDHMHLKPQSDFICDVMGRPLLNYLAYFETLTVDFENIAKILGSQAALYHVNASKREDYREIYTQDAIDKVRRIYQQDIDNFGYEFDRIKERIAVRSFRFEVQKG